MTYCPTGVAIGDVDDAIEVVLASNNEYFISKVPIPVYDVFAIEMCKVLQVIANPVFGMKSTIRFEPEKYGLYVPSPELEYGRTELFVNCPYSKN